MIELLVMINAQSPGTMRAMMDRGRRRYIDSQRIEPQVALDKRCPDCRGLKYQRDAQGHILRDENDRRVPCRRCDGSGKMFATGGQRTTFETPPAPKLTAQDVMALTAGMPDHWFWAAMVLVCEQQRLIGTADELRETTLLRHYAMHKLVIPKAVHWRVEPKTTVRRANGLVTLALAELTRAPESPLTQDVCAATLGINRKTYTHGLWQDRKQDLSARLWRYADQADHWMIQHYRGRGTIDHPQRKQDAHERAS